MRKRMIQCYRVKTDKSIEEYMMYPEQIDNKHTFFKTLEEALTYAASIK